MFLIVLCGRHAQSKNKSAIEAGVVKRKIKKALKGIRHEGEEKIIRRARKAGRLLWSPRFKTFLIF